MNEFFETRTVAEALEKFRPSHVTVAEPLELSEALGRVPIEPVVSPAALPGFARSTVDGFAVRAADTYGASEGMPTLLTLLGEVRMGRRAEVAVRAGAAVAVPTGGVLPEGADAVVMVEHTHMAFEGGVEIARPVAPGEGIVAADEDVATGAQLVPAGRPLRPADLALLAAAGVNKLFAHRRPRVATIATGDEVIPATITALEPGQVRDATSAGLAGMIRQAGGEPMDLGIVPDEPSVLEQRIAVALEGEADMVVVSAGSSVGGRDVTAAVVAKLATIWCHGLAVKPGKPTILAECEDGIPLVGLPGNPLSALVVFRLLGMPLVRRLGGWTAEPIEATVTATLDRPVRSAAGRLDIVQVSLDGGVATPLLGPSALLSRLSRAEGFITVPEEVTGLPAGLEVVVVLHG